MRFPFVLTLLVAALPAQVTITAEAKKRLGVFARDPNLIGTWKTVPAKTRLKSPFSLKAVDGPNYSEAKIDIDAARHEVVFQIEGQASGTASGYATVQTTNHDVYPYSGALEVTFRMTAPEAVTGKLIIDINNNGRTSWPARAFVTGAATFNNTTVSKSVTWALPVTRTFEDVTIDSSGITIQTTHSGLASTYFPKQGYTGTIKIRFVPDCLVTSIGTSCATLGFGFVAGEGIRKPGVLTMPLASNVPNGSILLALALEKTAGPISVGGGCNLLVNPLAIVASNGDRTTDAQGNARPMLLVPNLDLAFLLQAAVLDTQGGRLALTQGLDISCKQK